MGSLITTFPALSALPTVVQCFRSAACAYMKGVSPTALIGICVAISFCWTPANACAQSVVPMIRPQNHLIPGTADLTKEFPRSNTTGYGRPVKRRTIPTMRARFRPQDGDLFGEDQANPAEEGSIFEKLNEGPQPRATAPKPPQAKPPKIRARQANPFGEPDSPIPGFDPSPDPPMMDTRPEQADPIRQRTDQAPRPRQQMPRLPEGGEFTPDRDSVPDLPTPSGETRSTEKAGNDDVEADDLPGLLMPEEDDFEELDDAEAIRPDDRSPRSSRSSRRRRGTAARDRTENRRHRGGTNVYRPAREPSYYSMPTDPRMEAYRDTYGNYPPGMPNGYAPNPSASNPYASSGYGPNPYAAGPYGPNPYAQYGTADYGYAYACPPCPPCGHPPAPAANCGCGPQHTPPYPTDPRQQFAQPASTHCSPEVANEVYEGVVCGDQEIVSAANRCPKPATLTGGGGLSGDGPMLYYTSLFGGWTGLDDLMLSGEEGQIQIGNDDGVALGFAFGQIQGKNLRSELEITYRTNDLEGMTLTPAMGASQFLAGDGTIESVSGMLNIFWDFADLPTRRFKPYLGGGIGGVSVDADFQVNQQATLRDGNDTSLAYQWIAGINYQTNRFSDLFFEYRYFAADSLHFNTILPADSIIDGDGELEYRTSNLLFGMRLKF